MPRLLTPVTTLARAAGGMERFEGVSQTRRLAAADFTAKARRQIFLFFSIT
jgi:hypothetical protein